MRVFFLAGKDRTGKFPQHERYMLSKSPGNFKDMFNAIAVRLK
jgi:hypothetical protein